MPDPTGVVAVLTAAGSGSRLGSALPKALVELDGVPLVARAAQALAGDGLVDRLVVTAPAGDVDAVRAALAGATCVAVPVDVVAGGPTRQASVAAALRALAGRPGARGTDVVLVHDAARPLVPAEVVARVVAAVRAGHAAVVPGLPVTDTVKEIAAPDVGSPGADAARDGARVVATPDRRRLRAVQTPQGFTWDVLVAAHAAGAARAGDEATAATDDAALVEAAGGEVWVVAGDALALKVTTPLDLALAHVLLRGAS